MSNCQVFIITLVQLLRKKIKISHRAASGCQFLRHSERRDYELFERLEDDRLDLTLRLKALQLSVDFRQFLETLLSKNGL